MARTPSNMVKLGTLAPNFELLNTTNDELVSSEQIFNKNGTMVMFICNHCPFVIHVLDEIISISNKFKDEISFVAISSNDIVNYPQDSPDLMKKLALEKKFSFPYLMMKPKKLLKNTMQHALLIFSYMIKIKNSYTEDSLIIQDPEMIFLSLDLT